MQGMGLGSSRNKHVQQQCPTETPTGNESADITDIPIGMKAAPACCNTKAKEAAKTIPKRPPPHNYQAILKDADDDFQIDNSSMESLYNQLYDGVFLNQKRQKYWVDRETGSNCFMLYARKLSITWGDDDRYWAWCSYPETSYYVGTEKRDVSVEVAELIQVCWLEIHTKFDTTDLTPGTLYQVAFVIKMEETATGWKSPVTLRLNSPDGTTHEGEVNLSEKPTEQWIEIPVGEFQLSAENTNALEIVMSEIHSGVWKTGLAIKGVIIQPKKNTAP